MACSLVQDASEHVGHSFELFKTKEVRRSTSRRKRDSTQIRSFEVAPPPVSVNDDGDGWRRFLSAYRSGRWSVERDANWCEAEGEADEEEEDLDVRDVEGVTMSSKEYFTAYKHLAAPSLPRKKQRQRHEALLRHGLTHAHLRPHLQRYVELAKKTFDCDLVTLSFASADERHIIFIAADGPPMDQVPQCASICSHALLLDGENDIFVVPDMKQDWRFKSLFSKEGMHGGLGFSFHASAPIFLSSSQTTCCEAALEPVHAGRFSIFARESRQTFDQTSKKLLLTLARMTEEAMENTLLQSTVERSRSLHSSSDRVFRFLDDYAERRAGKRNVQSQQEDSISGDPGKKKQEKDETEAKFLSSTIFGDETAMQQVSQMIHRSLDAGLVCIMECPSLENGRNDPDWCGTSPELSSAVQLTGFYGDTSLMPNVQQGEKLDTLMQCLMKVRDQDQLQARKVHLFRRSDVIKQEPICCQTKEIKELHKAIDEFVPGRVKASFVLPIIHNAVGGRASFPIALLFGLWEGERATNPDEIRFCEFLNANLTTIAMRDQASKVRMTQLSFIQRMQHELRTPLNSLLCTAEAVSEQLDSKASSDVRRLSALSLDTTNGQLASNLAPQIQSIYASAMMLRTIVDDIVSFDTIAKSSSRPDVEEIDVGSEVEDACREGLDLFMMQSLRTLRTSTESTSAEGLATSAMPAPLIIELDEQVGRICQVSREKMRKIVGKLVENALRFTPSNKSICVQASKLSSRETDQRLGQTKTKRLTRSSSAKPAWTSAAQWIEISVHDTGIGMSEKFISERYFQPFHKADQFTQGIGLGTNVAQLLVESLGGSMTVQSRLDEGTKVCVYLPLTTDDTLQTGCVPLKKQGLSLAKRWKSAKLIGFELEEGTIAIARCLERCLQQQNISVSDSCSDHPAQLLFIHVSAFNNATNLSMQGVGDRDTLTIVITRSSLIEGDGIVERYMSDKNGSFTYLRPPFGMQVFSKLDFYNLTMSTLKADFDTSTTTTTTSVTVRDNLPSPQSIEQPSPEMVFKQVKDQFRVLVVEDNPVNMQLLKGLLRKVNMLFVEAVDGIEAVAQYKSFKPHLVLLDISLPLLDGFGVCLAMRAHDLPFRSKIIAVTALSTAEDRQRGLQDCGMDEWYTKPISLRAFRDALLRWNAEWVKEVQ